MQNTSSSTTDFRLVTMGVMGCGKSKIGAALASRLQIKFIDGDVLHPRANVEKMSKGQPLNDQDRGPWLRLVGRSLREGPAIIACSALKRQYRDLIRAEAGVPVCFIWLHGPRSVLTERVARRPGHFMPAHLLESQLATLEPPQSDEWYIEEDIQNSPEQIVDDLVQKLQGN